MRYSSQKIARAFREHFGKLEEVKVRMKYAREIGRFIRKVERAHRRTAKSKQVFKAQYPPTQLPTNLI